MLEKDHGLSLPRRLQIDFSRVIQKITDSTGQEIEAEEIWQVFKENYVELGDDMNYLSHSINSKSSPNGENLDLLKLKIHYKNKEILVEGEGNGPIDACIKGLSKLLGISLKISDYQQHAISSGADASAAAYIEITIDNKSFWGIGINSNTVAASFEAIMNGIKKSFS